MIEALAALSLSLSEPSTVTCSLEADGRRRRITQLTATCPNTDAQRAADALIARLDLPLRGDADNAPESLKIIRVPNGWDLEHPVHLSIYDYSRFPISSARFKDCSGTLRILPTGQAVDSDWACAVVNRSGQPVDGSRTARQFARLMSDTVWLLPARHDDGCAEITVAGNGGALPTSLVLDGLPQAELDPAERPTCDAFEFDAVYFDHHPSIPIEAAPTATSALCTATYWYDAAGFTFDHSVECHTRDGSGQAVAHADESESRRVVRRAYEAEVFRYASRKRVEPANEPFEGLREGDQEFDFSWQ